MNQYQFTRVLKRMERRFGKLRRGQEEDYNMFFFIIESNALKVHRKNPEAGSRRMKEGILLALYHMEEHLTGEKEDLSDFENEEALLMKHAVLMAFDPFENEEVRMVLADEYVLDDRDALKTYYALPAKLLLRLCDSIDFWEKAGGNDGYFRMLERTAGPMVPQDDKMNYIISAGSETMSITGF